MEPTVLIRDDLSEVLPPLLLHFLEFFFYNFVLFYTNQMEIQSINQLQKWTNHIQIMFAFFFKQLI